MDVLKTLLELQDPQYADFQSKLIPTISRDQILGVKVPKLRKLAKELIQGSASHPSPALKKFLEDLPHSYYDENILHSILISEIKNYDQCLESVDVFLPFVDNWAVCDIISPKVFQKHHAELLEKIKVWVNKKPVYTRRFGLKILMSHFLDADFQPEYLKIPAAIGSEEYYLKMMVAWFFATALAKQWQATIPYLEDQCLDRWTHQKTIQKACESYRITKQQKDYLKKLKHLPT